MITTNLFGLFYTLIITLFAGSIFYALLEKSKLFKKDDKSMTGLNLILAFSTSFFVAISPFVQDLLRIMTSYMTILIVLGFFILFIFYIFNYSDTDVKKALSEDEKSFSTILFIIIIVILIISLASSMGSDLLSKDLKSSTTINSIEIVTNTQTTPTNYNSSEYLIPYSYDSNSQSDYNVYDENNEFEENVFDTFFDSKVLALILFFLFSLIFVTQINTNRKYEE